MNLLLRPLPLLFVLAHWPAYAGGNGPNLNGLLTLVIGIPVLAIVCIIQLVMLALKPSQTVKILSAIVFLSSLVFGLFVAEDATTLMQPLGTENFAIGCIYFALLALSC